jgi:hypothetical protein
MAFGIHRAPALTLRASREGLPAAASADWRQRADVLPPSSRDTGNRISFAGLRAFAATRDSDLRPGRRRNRACNPSLSTRFR